MDEVGHSQKVLGYSAGPDIPAMIWLDFLLARGSPQHEAAEGSNAWRVEGCSLTEARERVVSRYKTWFSEPLHGDGDVDVSRIDVGGHLSDGRDKRLYDGQIAGKRCGAVAAADADEPALLHDCSRLLDALCDTCGDTAPAARDREQFVIAQFG